MNPAPDQRMPNFCDRHHPFHYATALGVLAKLGVDVHRIRLLAVGEYRNYCGEVQEQSPAPGTVLTDDTPVVLKVGYPSAVDYMPYQFFYGLTNGSERGTTWEESARIFMSPFDAAVIRYEAITLYQSLKYSFGSVEPAHLLKFLHLLDFTPQKTSPVAELMFWASVFPDFHNWGGNPLFVEKVLRYFLKHEVRIVENVPSDYEIPVTLRTRLGRGLCRVGKDMVLGRSFREWDSCYEVQVRDVPPEEVPDFLPGQEKRRLLEWLLSVCMPNNLDYRITLKTTRRKFSLGKRDRRGYLGYSSYV